MITRSSGPGCKASHADSDSPASSAPSKPSCTIFSVASTRCVPTRSSRRECAPNPSLRQIGESLLR